ncbi:pentapeptide repeat-containing protein [Ruegeria sp. 2012CJ41-6]|uniref:Pentapeptide repeat-containing protein n=1 Tax=Ruegeria spongiae TaxID=2942209 RepID=A0ABT0Q5B5_9RHOB|nr:pentapeptide repeat-containing protein [Ruegeria spongiae]MCL6285033.1 pentapeptide repeat-containing protein [Ruegeria spongiae]
MKQRIAIDRPEDRLGLSTKVTHDRPNKTLEQSMEASIFLTTHTIVWVALGMLVSIYVLLWVVTPEFSSNVSAPLERTKSELGLSKLNTFVFLVGAAFWTVILGMLCFGLATLIWDVVHRALPTERLEIWDWRFSLAKLAALTATTAAVVAFPLTLVRVNFSRRQTEVQEKGQITDRFSKSIEGLGTDKTITVEGEQVSVPNLEVRVGSILALSRIADETPSELQQVLRALIVYVRENSGTKHSPVNVDASPEFVEKFERLSFPRADVRTALETISDLAVPYRNQDSRNYLDLRSSSFKNQVIVGLNLSKFDLRICDFSGAFTQLCDFSGCRFHGSSFGDAKLTKLQLGMAKFDSCDFRGHVDFEESTLEGAFFQNCDLSTALITQEQLEQSYGDPSVQIPVMLKRPKHWSKRIRSAEEALARWEKFLAFKGYKSDQKSA